MRQIAFDTETTGLHANEGDRLIEIGCVELVDRRLTGRFWHTYLNPHREVHKDATKIHGITEDDLLHRPDFKDVVESFLDFIEDAELIAHNAKFDTGFLNLELALCRKEPLKLHCAKITDTLKMARDMRGANKRNTLDALCKVYKIDASGRDLHGALIDADLLARLYLEMTAEQGALALNVAVEEERKVKGSSVNGLGLTVVRATDEELSAHAAMVAKLEKGPATTIWGESVEGVSSPDPELTS